MDLDLGARSIPILRTLTEPVERCAMKRRRCRSGALYARILAALAEELGVSTDRLPAALKNVQESTGLTLNAPLIDAVSKFKVTQDFFDGTIRLVDRPSYTNVCSRGCAP